MMGYFIKQTDSWFKIANKNSLATLQSLKEMARNIKEKGKNLDWISLDRLLNSITLNEAIMYCRWFAYVDHEGNVIDMHFPENKLGDDELILKTLAPYVEPGSYIDIEGEDAAVWRWLFKDGILKTIDIRGERTIEEIRETILDLSYKWFEEPKEKKFEDLKQRLLLINDWKFLDTVLDEIQNELIQNFYQLYKKIYDSTARR